MGAADDLPPSSTFLDDIVSAWVVSARVRNAGQVGVEFVILHLFMRLKGYSRDDPQGMIWFLTFFFSLLTLSEERRMTDF